MGEADGDGVPSLLKMLHEAVDIWRRMRRWRAIIVSYEDMHRWVGCSEGLEVLAERQR